MNCQEQFDSQNQIRQAVTYREHTPKRLAIKLPSRLNTIRTGMRLNVAFGFLILAGGLMLTDVCKLMRADSATSAASGRVTRVHRL